MLKYLVACAAVLCVGMVVRAGEMDRESASGPAAPAKIGVEVQKTFAASEMDKESPQQSWHWRGGWGYWRGYYGSRFYSTYYYPSYYYRPYYYSYWTCGCYYPRYYYW